MPDDSLTIDERRGRAVEQPDVVADDRHLPRDGRAHGCTVPRPDQKRKRRSSIHGPAEKKHIFYHSKNSNQAGELDFTYYNAVYTVENALAKVKDEKGMKRVEKFLKEETCPECRGTRALCCRPRAEAARHFAATRPAR